MLIHADHEMNGFTFAPMVTRHRVTADFFDGMAEVRQSIRVVDRARYVEVFFHV
jgi:hypothetical protein